MVAQRHDGSPRGMHLKIKSKGRMLPSPYQAVTPACSRAFAPMEYAREYPVRFLVVTHESLTPSVTRHQYGPHHRLSLTNYISHSLPPSGSRQLHEKEGKWLVKERDDGMVVSGMFRDKIR